MSDWPDTTVPIFERAFTCEFATVTRKGTPVTWPLTPYLPEDRKTIDVSTGLVYPRKAERARRNPNVSLLFADPVGTKLNSPPVVLVMGKATVKDTNLQDCADRYIRVAHEKFPAIYRYTPWWYMKRHAWYWVRIWIRVTPLRILWWPGADLDKDPLRWESPPDGGVEPSDPEPPGEAPGGYQLEPSDWRDRAEEALERLGTPDLTVVDSNGWPVAFPVHSATRHPQGFRLLIPDGVPVEAVGPACLTFHTHAEVFIGQENASFVGQVEPGEETVVFRVERLLGDFSLAGGRWGATWSFLGKARVLAPRLEPEVKRRGEPMPEIRRT
ncbi:MAG: pyridoxamine 5'-phosphate oxidase family protein [Actinomycetota bacterium]|nr:pyridoxamine 5'-phosphate oxidase family protein [Actinomycetota bacterium]